VRVERFLAASTVFQLTKSIATEESPLKKKKLKKRKKRACYLLQCLTNRGRADPVEGHKPHFCTTEHGPHVKSFRKLSLPILVVIVLKS